MLNELRSGCGLGGVGRSKPERAELRNQIYVGSSVPPESPSMKPETGRLSATHASKVMKVAESQNGKINMRIEELLEALKNVMGWDRCIEFKYFPRRNEVVAKVDLEKGMSDGELLAISGILKDLGFSGFWIDSGECDILEDRYIAPEIEFRAKDIDPELIKFLRRHGDSYIVCKR